jgi:hypothetical protein
MSLHHLTLMVTDIFECDGCDPTALPGWNDLPPSRSPSPSAQSTQSLSIHSAGAQSAGAQSTSSTGVGLAALTLAETQSLGHPIQVLSHTHAPSQRQVRVH